MNKHIHSAVCKCLHNCPQVEDLIDELNRLIDTEGASCCQAILLLLAHIEMPAAQAEKYWHEIVAHRQQMSSSIGRPLSLQTAICDFFSSIKKDLKHPKVIEIQIFDEMVRKSNRDSLTGLGNRVALDRSLEQEIARARRYHREVALLFLDLDNFKLINDTFGHQAGDAVLREVGKVIASAKRVEDTAGRYGGEEFIVILPDTGKMGALILAERIRELVAAIKVPFGDETLQVTVSGGLACWPSDAINKASLTACADQALYKAKNNGKNIIVLYGEEKRRYVRIDFVKKLDIRVLQDEQGSKAPVTGKNISLGGVLFESKDEIAMDSRLELTLHGSEEGPLVINGHVRRLELLDNGNYEVGVSFLHFEKKVTHSLGLYIQHYLSQQGISCPATQQALKVNKAPAWADLPI